MPQMMDEISWEHYYSEYIVHSSEVLEPQVGIRYSVYCIICLTLIVINAHLKSDGKLRNFFYIITPFNFHNNNNNRQDSKKDVVTTPTTTTNGETSTPSTSAAVTIIDTENAALKEYEDAHIGNFRLYFIRVLFSL